MPWCIHIRGRKSFIFPLSKNKISGTTPPALSVSNIFCINSSRGRPSGTNSCEVRTAWALFSSVEATLYHPYWKRYCQNNGMFAQRQVCQVSKTGRNFFWRRQEQSSSTVCKIRFNQIWDACRLYTNWVPVKGRVYLNNRLCICLYPSEDRKKKWLA